MRTADKVVQGTVEALGLWSDVLGPHSSYPALASFEASFVVLPALGLCFMNRRCSHPAQHRKESWRHPLLPGGGNRKSPSFRHCCLVLLPALSRQAVWEDWVLSEGPSLCPSWFWPVPRWGALAMSMVGGSLWVVCLLEWSLGLAESLQNLWQ